MSSILDTQSSNQDTLTTAVGDGPAPENAMNASFEEKSVWIQLVGLLVVLGGYFVVAARMFSAGVTVLPPYAGLFIGAVVLLVVVLVAGHIVVAVASRPDGPDERDRVVGWRAESNSAWVLAAGVFTAIMGLVAAIDTLWIAHLLLFSLFASEVLKLVLQLVYYRRGM